MLMVTWSWHLVPLCWRSKWSNPSLSHYNFSGHPCFLLSLSAQECWAVLARLLSTNVTFASQNLQKPVRRDRLSSCTLRSLLSYPIICFLWQRSHSGISQFLRESWTKCSRALIGRPLSSMAVISWFSENNAANFSENKNWYYLVLPKNPSWTPGLGPMAFLSPFLFAVVVVVFLKFFVTPSPPLPTHFCVFLL